MKKRNKGLMLLMLACLIGAAVLGALALRVILERRGGALGHQREAAYIHVGAVTEEPSASPRPTSAATPEPEVMEAEDAGLWVNEAISDHPPADGKPTPEPTPLPTPRTGRTVASDVRYTMDFDQLEQVNKDVRGWLICEGTSINYPVAQAENNTYYLEHLFTGGENRTGAIFMDCGSSRYFTDVCTWLYGHNRKDDTMFAVLPSYMEQAFYEEHPVMYLLTPYEDYRVDIFACIRSSVTIEAEWRVKSFDGREAFEAYIDRIRGQSAIKTEVVPAWGDQLLAMCTCTNEVRDDRYVVFGLMRPLSYTREESSLPVAQLALAERDSYTKTVNIPGRGEQQYYAQNDPTWADLRYERRASTQRRTFGQAGCGPTALAMALASVTTDEQLSRLLVCPSSEKGFSFCTCSVNQYFCNKRHVQFRVRMVEDLRQYLPIVLANFATGNNLWGIQSRSENAGTGIKFYRKAVEACDLDYRETKDAEEAIAAVQAGAAAVVISGGKSSPFTGAGHYLTLVHADDQYLYFLDPYNKEDYAATDKRHVLEVLERGVVRVRREDLPELQIVSYYLAVPRAPAPDSADG